MATTGDRIAATRAETKPRAVVVQKTVKTGFIGRRVDDPRK